MWGCWLGASPKGPPCRGVRGTGDLWDPPHSGILGGATVPCGTPMHRGSAVGAPYWGVGGDGDPQDPHTGMSGVTVTRRTPMQGFGGGGLPISPPPSQGGEALRLSQV